MSRPLARAVRLTALLVMAGVWLFSRPAWADCATDTDCKAPRICVGGACVNPPPTAPPGCTKDIECGGELVCEAHRCIDVAQSTQPPANPPAVAPAGDDVSAPPPAMPTTPPSGDPPPPPPVPPPPPGYSPRPVVAVAHRPPKPVGWKFDLDVGPAIMLVQQTGYPWTNLAALGGAFDAGAGYGFAQNFGLGIRGGGLIGAWPAQMFYFGPGVFMPSWHWGLYTAAMNLGVPTGKGREWGFHLEMPCEFPIWRMFKLVVSVGVGVTRDATEETLRVGIGI